jgi:hypothetical protein
MDGLQIARTLKFAASIGMRAGAMNAEDLQRKRLALDRLLDQTEIELYELQVLLRQRSADILVRVERDLTTQVAISVREVQQHMKLFQVQHPKESGRAFGDLLEDFLMKEVEMVFRKWRTQEDEEVQTQLDTLSFRFVTQANGILERLEQAAGVLFEIPVEHLAISCPLRVESHLYYKVERVFYSLDSFLLLLPRFLLRPIVLRRMHNNVPRMLDMNAGRIRYDYLERLQSSMNQFERDIRGAITMVSESLKSALQVPGEKGQQNTETLGVLDSLIRDCSCLAR